MTLPGAGAGVVARLVDVAVLMRSRGCRVSTGQLVLAHRALAAVDAGAPREARLALRSALCSSPRDQAVFDWACACVLGDGDAGAEPLPELEVVVDREVAAPGAPDPGDAPHDDPVAAAWSDAELLRHKDFAAYGPADVAAARRLLARLARRSALRRSRRTRPSRRPTGTPDVPATLRRSLRFAGEPVERRWRRPVPRPRPVVLVADVSGSMAPYVRMMLEYLRASVLARPRVEAFVFGTRLSRVTRELVAAPGADAALARVSAQVLDWSGGTRMGDALAELNRRHAGRVGRGAIVVVLSDGWDRGDPERLGAEMARLARCAHRVVWLNPLAADPRYEPLTRAMQAALPHVDELLAGNSVASLEALADLLDGALR